MVKNKIKFRRFGGHLCRNSWHHFLWKWLRKKIELSVFFFEKRNGPYFQRLRAIFRGNGAHDSYISDPQRSSSSINILVRSRSTTLDLHSSLGESGSYFQNAEGVRFLGVQLQTALTSRLLGHIRADFTHGTMMIHILQILVRFWNSTWIFAWYVDTSNITHPVYQKL